MLQVKLKSALRLLSQSGRGHIRSLDDTVDEETVREFVNSIYQAAEPISEGVLLPNNPPDAHTVMFDRLYGRVIRADRQRTGGSVRP